MDPRSVKPRSQRGGARRLALAGAAAPRSSAGLLHSGHSGHSSFGMTFAWALPKQRLLSTKERLEFNAGLRGSDTVLRDRDILACELHAREAAPLHVPTRNEQ